MSADNTGAPPRTLWTYAENPYAVVKSAVAMPFTCRFWTAADENATVVGPTFITTTSTAITLQFFGPPSVIGHNDIGWTYGTASATKFVSWDAQTATPEQQAQWAKESAQRHVAEKRAVRLFQRILTKRQTATWQRWGFIDIPSKWRPEVEYRIAAAGGVLELVRGAPARSFCVYPREVLPRGDKLIALKCFIEADELEFLATANKTRLDGADLPVEPRYRIPASGRLKLQAA